MQRWSVAFFIMQTLIWGVATVMVWTKTYNSRGIFASHSMQITGESQWQQCLTFPVLETLLWWDRKRKLWERMDIYISDHCFNLTVTFLQPSTWNSLHDKIFLLRSLAARSLCLLLLASPPLLPLTIMLLLPAIMFVLPTFIPLLLRYSHLCLVSVCSFYSACLSSPNNRLFYF